jgi:hypothetical protein
VLTLSPADDLVIFASCNNNDAQQRWWVTDDQHFALKDSGKCLDVRDGGTVMQIYDCTYNNHNQMFV